VGSHFIPSADGIFERCRSKVFGFTCVALGQLGSSSRFSVLNLLGFPNFQLWLYFCLHIRGLLWVSSETEVWYLHFACLL
jgi:hypothetical protein